MRRLAGAFAFFFGATAAVLAALTFPALTGRVVDEAGILDAQSRAVLTQKLADLEAKTSDQIVVVTLKSLQGTSIEDFGVQLGRHWQIGQAGKNNGALLIVAPMERKVRIEVGYGLEGTLTDAIARFIIANSIIPRFRADDLPGGIARGVEDIIEVLAGDADEYKQRAASAMKPSGDDSIWPGVVILLIVALVWAFCFAIGGVICELIYDGIMLVSLFTGKSGSSSRSSGWGGGGGSFGGGGASGGW
jgi:uncharacterized protein